MTDQETITLAQWCAYLPYGVKILCRKKVKTLTGVMNETLLFNGKLLGSANMSECKPLLRPMNEGAEYEIDRLFQHYCNTEEYRYIHKTGFYNLDSSSKDFFTYEYLPYKLIQALLSNHYDIFNLIGRGLALPIE